MNNPLLVSVLHRLAHVDEQIEPGADGQVTLVAKIGDGNAANQFHYKVRTAGYSCTAVKDMGDVRMIHEGQRLSLHFKAVNHLARVHARFEDLESYLAPDRLRLLGHEDDTETAFADLFQKFEWTDDRAGLFGRGFVQRAD